MLAIRNYGHYWSRDLVYWGKRGDSGDLNGYRMVQREPFKVNFRDQIGIYVLFDGQRRVVYIGQAGRGDQRLFVRLRQHTRDDLRDRWTNFSWFGFRAVNKSGGLSSHQDPDSRCGGTHSDALNEVEASLLQILEPPLNKQGPRWGEGTDEYLQYDPSEWGEEAPEPIGKDAKLLFARLAQLEQRLDTLTSGKRARSSR